MPGAPFGASVAGVEGHVSDIHLTDSSRPTRSTVEEWLKTIGGQVSGAAAGYATLENADPLAYAEVVDTARGLVNLGAAAWVADAAFPERADGNSASLGEVLWARYKDGLASLTARVAQLLAAVVTVDVSAGDQVLFSFPAPLVHRDRRF